MVASKKLPPKSFVPVRKPKHSVGSVGSDRRLKLEEPLNRCAAFLFSVWLTRFFVVAFHLVQILRYSTSIKVLSYTTASAQQQILDGDAQL